MDYKITRLTDNPEIKEKAAQWFMKNGAYRLRNI